MLVIDEHTGTHIDAPRHFVPPPGSRMPGRAATPGWTSCRCWQRPGSSPRVTTAELTAWETAHGELCPGDVMLLRTGWDSRYRGGPSSTSYGANALVTRTGPGWPAPTARWQSPLPC